MRIVAVVAVVVVTVTIVAVGVIVVAVRMGVGFVVGAVFCSIDCRLRVDGGFQDSLG